MSGAERTKLSAAAANEFDVGVTLGTGSFGRVRFATHKGTGSHWAIKILKKSEVIRLQQVEHMIWEKTILEASDHPFIVFLTCTFQDPRHLYMVLEYVVGGEFFTHLRNAGMLGANEAKFYPRRSRRSSSTCTSRTSSTATSSPRIVRSRARGRERERER